MSNQNQHQPPITVDEALRLFNEVSHLTVRDAQDNERFAESRNNNKNANINNNAAATGTKRTPSSTSRTTPRGTDADLRRQLELSEAVMKKLHAKNKTLTQEIDDLKQQHRNNSNNNNGNTSGRNNAAVKQLPNNNNNIMSAAEQAELESLRKRVLEQDSQIKLLKQQQQQQQTANSNNSRPSSAHGKPPLANLSNVENQNSIISSSSAPTTKILEKRIIQLQQQYDALVDVKLECIRDGESTGKVNKEVKSFFVSSRQKMMDDAAFHEAERVLLNEKISKLENELMKFQRK